MPNKTDKSEASTKTKNFRRQRKSKEFSRKSQMEILGLAIVVVLILVATIFIVRFLVLKTPTDYRKGFISSELASNMLNTFLKTAARDCSQLTMTELLQDCAQGRGIICDNGKDSCKYAEETAKNIFENTLDKWNMKYEFSAYTNINSPLIKLGQQCRAEKRSKLFPIPISTATMYVKLDICG
ncbi:hypothetical protein HYX02_07890 [Candidatus Woesearchaeota archaeon]|nr:hypothetical protein [Candidatus Woesearchaeota archaeon]